MSSTINHDPFNASVAFTMAFNVNYFYASGILIVDTVTAEKNTNAVVLHMVHGSTCNSDANTTPDETPRIHRTSFKPPSRTYCVHSTLYYHTLLWNYIISKNLHKIYYNYT